MIFTFFFCFSFFFLLSCIFRIIRPFLFWIDIFFLLLYQLSQIFWLFFSRFFILVFILCFYYLSYNLFFRIFFFSCFPFFVFLLIFLVSIVPAHVCCFSLQSYSDVMYCPVIFHLFLATYLSHRSVWALLFSLPTRCFITFYLFYVETRLLLYIGFIADFFYFLSFSLFFRSFHAISIRCLFFLCFLLYGSVDLFYLFFLVFYLFSCIMCSYRFFILCYLRKCYLCFVFMFRFFGFLILYCLIVKALIHPPI